MFACAIVAFRFASTSHHRLHDDVLRNVRAAADLAAACTRAIAGTGDELILQVNVAAIYFDPTATLTFLNFDYMSATPCPAPAAPPAAPATAAPPVAPAPPVSGATIDPTLFDPTSLPLCVRERSPDPLPIAPDASFDSSASASSQSSTSTGLLDALSDDDIPQDFVSVVNAIDVIPSIIHPSADAYMDDDSFSSSLIMCQQQEGQWLVMKHQQSSHNVDLT